VDQREQLAHKFPVFATARHDHKLSTLARDLRAIAIAHASTTTKRADGLRLDSFKVVDQKLFAVTKKEVEKRCERSLASQRRAVKSNPIAEREHGHDQPGNCDHY